MMPLDFSWSAARRLMPVGFVLAALAAVSWTGCTRAGNGTRADAAQSSSTEVGAGGVGGSPAAPVTPISGQDLLRKVRESKAPAVLVNMWATWCMPCREEFPDLVRLKRAYEGRDLEVILVSGDFDSEMPEVRRFLEEQGVDFPTYIKTGKDMEFINGFEAGWSGALPATFLYDSGGSLRHAWEEKGSYAQFEQKVLELLGKSAAGAAREDAS